jgi:hypothetical protein
MKATGKSATLWKAVAVIASTIELLELRRNIRGSRNGRQCSPWQHGSSRIMRDSYLGASHQAEAKALQVQETTKRMRLATALNSALLLSAILFTSSCQGWSNEKDAPLQGSTQSRSTSSPSGSSVAPGKVRYPTNQCTILSAAELSATVAGRPVHKTASTTTGKDGCGYYVDDVPGVSAGIGNMFVAVSCASRDPNTRRLFELAKGRLFPVDGPVPGAVRIGSNDQPVEDVTAIVDDCIISASGIKEVPGSGTRLMVAFYTKVVR